MQVLGRQRDGTVQVRLDSPDDLWYLHTLLHPGDRVRGESEYKEKLGSSEEKARVVKRRVWVLLTVERSEIIEDRVRVLGTVIDGSEEVPRGSHHGLDLGVGETVSITKEWSAYDDDLLRRAVQGSGAKTIVVLFDREKAQCSLLTPRGVEPLLELRGDVPKKGVDETRQHHFYQEIAGKMTELAERHKVQHIVAASPAFWKSYLEKELPPALKGKVIFAPISDVDPSAVTELLRRPEVQHALQGQRAAEELQFMDTMKASLAKDKLAYGSADVRTALADGNLSILFVTEHAIGRAQGGGEDLDSLLRAAAKVGADVHILTTTEATSMLDGLGGIAGVRRW